MELAVNWAYVAFVAASTMYQQDQSRKAKNAAEDRQKAADEARKGFEFPTEGSVTTIPLVYGKALVGGNRVWHSTGSSFSYTAPNGQKTFKAGADAQPGGSYTSKVYSGGDAGDWTDVTVDYSGTQSTFLDRDLSGTKNEFLYFQQALCLGPIQEVRDVVINEGLYIDNPLLGTYPTGAELASRMDLQLKAAALISVHYGDTPTADSIISKNFGSRANSVFTGVAYASSIFRMDRDGDKVFNGVPTQQFSILGRKVHTVTSTYQLSGSRVYSNNPAYCLLDYLMDPTVGRGLPAGDIDLESFYKSALVCETTVGNYPVGGKLYQNTDGTSTITSRDVPLYECNLIINSTKSLRDNVESILATMGDARLVWSGGKYKLILQYPASNSAIQLAGTITDDDIVNSTISLTWPGASERLNFCNIKFHNECEGFKEDSASWPPKTSGKYFKGIGGTFYANRSGWTETTSNYEFLNDYAVWNGSQTTTTLVYHVMPKLTGSYTFKLAADNHATLALSNGAFGSLTSDNMALSTLSVSLTKDVPFKITITGTNDGGIFGVAATLTNLADSTLLWSTRSEAFSSYLLKEETNAVYLQYKDTEDSGLELEQDIFVDGITDYYHALAKAEETVRTSRTAASIKLDIVLRDRFYEPGDIIKLESESLAITSDFYFKVNEIQLKDGGVAEISGIRFDSSQLAWNVDDADAGSPLPIGFYGLPPPTNFTYTAPTSADALDGKLSWLNSSDTRINGYILYFHESDDMDESGRPVFNEIGRASKGPFVLSGFGNKSGIFGVRSYSPTLLSVLVTTSDTSAIVIVAGKTPPAPANLMKQSNFDEVNVVNLKWTVPSLRADNSDYDDHAFTKIFQASVDSFASAKFVDSSYGDSKRVAVSGNGTFYFWAVNVSTRKKESSPSNSVSALIEPTVNQMLTVLTGAIREDQLWVGLGARIDLVDNNATGSVNQRVNTAKVDAATYTQQALLNVGMPGGLPSNAITSLQTSDANQNTSITNLNTTVGSHSSSITGILTTNADQAASITNLNTTVGTNSSNITTLLSTTAGQATRLTNLETDNGANKSNITNLQITTTNTASDVTTLSSTVGGNSSNIATLLSTTAGQATRLTNLETDNGANKSNITTLQTTTTNTASDVTTLNSTVDGHSTSIQNTSTTVNGLSAQYTVKIDNNGYVSGFGLASTQVNGTPYSRFYIRSDAFAIGGPDTSGSTDANVPFIVRTSTSVVNGLTIPAGVYMKSAFIETVTADRVDTRGLTIKDNYGNVVFSAGNGLNVGLITGLGSLATQNSVMRIRLRNNYLPARCQM